MCLHFLPVLLESGLQTRKGPSSCTRRRCIRPIVQDSDAASRGGCLAVPSSIYYLLPLPLVGKSSHQQLTGCGSSPLRRSRVFHGSPGSMPGIIHGFPWLSPMSSAGCPRVTQLSPLYTHPKVLNRSGVLGAPPAFILSQDELLHSKLN